MLDFRVADVFSLASGCSALVQWRRKHAYPRACSTASHVFQHGAERALVRAVIKVSLIL
jgi:hypothetical protein